MLTYSDVKTFLEAALTDRGYATTLPATSADAKPMPVFDPGPFSLAQLQDLAPGSIVFVTVGNGAGLAYEQTYDQVFVTVRAIGPQNDYDAAEALAQDIDKALLGLNGSGPLGATRVLYVTRSGGGPQLIDYDDGDRYHFQTTYVTPAATGL